MLEHDIVISLFDAGIQDLMIREIKDLVVLLGVAINVAQYTVVEVFVVNTDMIIEPKTIWQMPTGLDICDELERIIEYRLIIRWSGHNDLRSCRSHYRR